MSRNEYKVDGLGSKSVVGLVDQCIKASVIFDVMVEKGLITEEEISERYQTKFEEKGEEYAANILDITVEEYRKRVKKDN